MSAIIDLFELHEAYKSDAKFDHMREDPKIRFVPGTGEFNPQIMIIGEAPGELENARQIPFVGRAGANLMQLLDKVGIPLADVYLTNSVKYRPTDQFGKNRTPSPEEMEASRDYLRREIELVNPKVIGLAGKVPFRTIFPRETSPRIYGDFSKIHGTLLEDKYVPLYHPAVLTYKPNQAPVIERGYRRLKYYADR